jgi:hypothetical protein
MSKMKMPGFTAECALYGNHDRYQNCTRMAPNPQVIPQAIDEGCWLNAWYRTYYHCRYIGYGSVDCMLTAYGLADSVCDF